MQSGIGQQRQKRNHEHRNNQSDPVQSTPSWKWLPMARNLAKRCFTRTSGE
jgi:hypothetical protein